MRTTHLPGGTEKQSTVLAADTKTPTPAPSPGSSIFHRYLGRKKEWIYSYLSSQQDGKQDDPQKHSSYKLDIFLSPTEFDKTKVDLVQTLIDAVEQKSIHSFKCISEEALRSGSDKKRLKHMPYTIYLPNLYEYASNTEELIERSLKHVIPLCNKIEKILKPYDAGDEKLLAICDLPLSKHIRFRLGGLEKEKHIAVRNATHEQLNALKTKGENSRRYKFLFGALKPIREEYSQIQARAAKILKMMSEYNQVVEDRIITNQTETIKAIEKFLLSCNDDQMSDNDIGGCLTFKKTSSKKFLCFFCNDVGELVFTPPERTMVEHIPTTRK